MKNKDDYNSKAALTRVKKSIENNLDRPIEPSWDKCLIKWKGLCKFKPPRTFLHILDIKQNQTILSNGMSIIGYSDSQLFSSEELLNLIHVNQQNLLSHQVFGLYEMFFSHPHLFRVKGVVCCSLRAIKASNNKFWLAHQTSSPFQFDKNGIVTRYISYYQILREYNGEPLETEIYTHPEFPREQKELRGLMMGIKQNTLHGLGFSKTHKQIINYTSIGADSNGIMEAFDIKKRTLDNHRAAINQIARIVFPENNFKNIYDVVEYLKRQNII